MSASTSRFNPIHVLDSHPIPEDSEAVRELQRDSWDFCGAHEEEPEEYATREELLDSHVDVESTAGSWKLLRVRLTGFGRSFVLWNGESEFGFKFSNEEGEFYRYARAIRQAWETINEVRTNDDGAAVEEPLTPVSDNPLIMEPDEVEARQRAGDLPFVGADEEVVHRDAVYDECRNVVGEFNGVEAFTSSLHDDALFVWDRELGEGIRISLPSNALVEVFAEFFDDEQLEGDGSCPRCLGEMSSRSYPHGPAVGCSGCGFEIGL